MEDLHINYSCYLYVTASFLTTLRYQAPASENKSTHNKASFKKKRSKRVSSCPSHISWLVIKIIMSGGQNDLLTGWLLLSHFGTHSLGFASINKPISAPVLTVSVCADKDVIPSISRSSPAIVRLSLSFSLCVLSSYCLPAIHSTLCYIHSVQ